MAARDTVSTRIGTAGVAILDELAATTHTDRSKAHRAVLAAALADRALLERARRALTDGTV